MKTAKDIDGNSKIIGRRVLNKLDYYEEPYPSSFYDIFHSDNSLGEESDWEIDDIDCKMWGVTDLNNHVIFFPLIHTFSKGDEEQQ